MSSRTRHWRVKFPPDRVPLLPPPTPLNARQIDYHILNRIPPPAYMSMEDPSLLAL